MLRRSFALVFLVLLGCAHPPPIPMSSKQSRTVPPFTRVQVDGAFHVSLHTGYKQPRVILWGDARDLAKVSTTVVNGALLVTREPCPCYGDVRVEIRGRYLNSFAYHGKGVVTGKRLRSNRLDLHLDNQGKTILGGKIALRNVEVTGRGYTEIKGINSNHLRLSLSGTPKVQLAGVANLTSLTMSDAAWLSLYWVKSKNLLVRAQENAFIQLAGIVDKLDVELCDKARFNGRYLRANRAFVKTHHKSVAEISALDHQHALAQDSSDIRFYNLPKMKADFMADDGSVLDFRNWSMPLIQQYDRYNK